MEEEQGEKRGGSLRHSDWLTGAADALSGQHTASLANRRAYGRFGEASAAAPPFQLFWVALLGLLTEFAHRHHLTRSTGEPVCGMMKG